MSWFQIFGGVVPMAGDRAIDVSAQSRRLLGVLLADRTRSVTTDVLIDRLWEGRPPPTAPKVIQVLVGRLRRALEPDSSASTSRIILTTPVGYAIHPPATDLDDYLTFVRLAHRDEQSDPTAALGFVDRALALWTGRPWGAQADESWLRPSVSKLEEEHSQLEELWGELMLATGQAAAAISRLHAAVQAGPLRERRWCQLMVALYRSARQAEALRTYDDARKILRDELGVSPGPELRKLELAVLQQDPALLDPRPAEDVAFPTSFVGRTHELNALDAAVKRSRLVTLVGLGGIGKTRIAAEYAHRQRLAGVPVRFVSLAELHHPERLEGHVAEALGLHPDPPAEPAALLAAFIHVDPVLLVIDRAEAFATEVTGLILRLIERCPRLRILVTSRVPIGLPGELTVDVPPLPVTDDMGGAGAALALLVDRLGVDPHALDGTMRARLSQICARTGGIPLLLELAAVTADLGEAPAAPGAALGAPSRDAIALIRSGVRDALAAVDPAAHELLTMAAPLPAGLSDRIAVGLGHIDEAHARRLLRQLAWARLVEVRTGRATLRYRSLDPVRDALSAEVDTDEWAKLVAGAGPPMVSLLGGLRPSLAEPVVAPLLDVVEDEHDNIRFLVREYLASDPATALELCTRAAEFWPYRGYGVEGARSLETAMAAARPHGLARWRAVVALARTTRTFAEISLLHEQLESVVTEMLDGTGTDDLGLHGTALVYLAIARGWRGDHEGFAAALDRAEQALKAAGTPWSTGQVDRLRGLGHALAGDVERARERQWAFATLMEEVGDTIGAAQGWYMAATLADLGGLPGLEDDIARARAAASAAGDVSQLAQLLRLEARMLRRTRDARAHEVLRAAIEELAARGGIRGSALARRDLGLLELEGGNVEAARRDLSEALTVLLQLDRPAAALACAGLAAIARSGDDALTAARLATSAGRLEGAEGVLARDDVEWLRRLLGGDAPRLDSRDWPDDDAALLALATEMSTGGVAPLDC